MATETQTIISRQDPEVEAYYRNLMAATTAMAPPTLPGYEVAGMTQPQLDVIAAARQGIGTYQPFLARALEDVQAGGATVAEGAGYLRDADTTQALQQARQQMGGYSQANLGASQDLLGQSVQAMQGAGQAPAFAQGIGALYGAAEQGQQAAQLGAAPTATAARFDRPRDVSAGTVGGQRVSAPGLRDFSMRAAPNIGASTVSTDQIRGAQTNFAPGIEAFRMGPAERVRASSSILGPRAASTRSSGGSGVEAASSASRYSGNDSHPQVMPSLSAVPGMSSTPSSSSIRKSW